MFWGRKWASSSPEQRVGSCMLVSIECRQSRECFNRVVELSAKRLATIHGIEVLTHEEETERKDAAMGSMKLKVL